MAFYQVIGSSSWDFAYSSVFELYPLHAACDPKPEENEDELISP